MTELNESNETKRLCDIAVGENAVVERLMIHGSMRRRMLDIGLCDGTVVECVGRSPMGDPSAYLIRGAVIAIRDCDSRGVIVRGI
ncbi:MAG: ferrous iron transport protein A [Ruminococcaceae bacterium]|nr:ferrous iron transport protein A [Oscillospiraceae bacterium]